MLSKLLHLCLLICTVRGVFGSFGAGNGDQPAYIEDQYIVLLHEEANPHVWQASSPGTTVQCHSDAVNAVTLSNVTETEAFELWQDPMVAHVEQDRTIRLTRSDPCSRSLQSRPADCDAEDLLHAGRSLQQTPSLQPLTPVQTIPTGVQRVNGPFQGFITEPIAVLDTGVGPHADINVASAYSCIAGKPLTDDQNGHGTHVAGIAAAINNGFGVVGVAPGAPIHNIKILDFTGYGTISSLICGIDYVVANNLSHVLVMSFETDPTPADALACDNPAIPTTAMHQAICNAVEAGIIVTVAAGNEGNDVSSHIPAAYPEVISVGALADYDGLPGGLANALDTQRCAAGPDDTVASDSNHGASLSILAPGVCINSTYITEQSASGYFVLSGTSMAAPHVAGAAAVLRQQTGGNLNPAAAKEILSQPTCPYAASQVLFGDPDHEQHFVLDLKCL